LTRLRIGEVDVPAIRRFLPGLKIGQLRRVLERPCLEAVVASGQIGLPDETHHVDVAKHSDETIRTHRSGRIDGGVRLGLERSVQERIGPCRVPHEHLDVLERFHALPNEGVERQT
jgi:hypothetical protein